MQLVCVVADSMEEEIYCSVISAHEDKHKQLVVENYELREMLTHVLTQLSVLPTCHCHSQSPGETHSYHDDDCKVSAVFPLVAFFFKHPNNLSCLYSI